MNRGADDFIDVIYTNRPVLRIRRKTVKIITYNSNNNNDDETVLQS